MSTVPRKKSEMPQKVFFSTRVLHQNTELYLLSFYGKTVQVTGERVGLSLERQVKRG